MTSRMNTERLGVVDAQKKLTYYNQNGELIFLSPRIKPVETLRVSLVHSLGSGGGGSNNNHQQHSLPTSSHSSSSTSSSYHNDPMSPKPKSSIEINDENSYEKLADYWLDFTCAKPIVTIAKQQNKDDNTENLANHSTCNYPDLLENSVLDKNEPTKQQTEALCFLNEIVDDDDEDDRLSQDVISLNVDFSNEDEPYYERFQRVEKVKYDNI